MYGIYDGIIGAAERALGEFGEVKDLLEYPEVQADKAYYLSVLKKYNELCRIKNSLSELLSALEEQRAVFSLLSEASSEEERAAVYEEISALKRKASALSSSLSDALGCKHAEERAYCRFKLKESSSAFGKALFSLIKSYLLSRGAEVGDEKFAYAKSGYAEEISFVAEGSDVITRLMPLAGAHRVYTAQAKYEELCFAVTPFPKEETVTEADLKIDVFHSHGAGGQNINKVETAVRVTHLPTGLSVVCQDERSQLKNKKRALETIKIRLKDRSGQSEKKRIEADIYAQYSRKNTPLSFDAENKTFTDTRIKQFNKVAFPPADGQFATYMDGLISL